MAENNNVFKTLSNIDLSEKVKEKNKLKYVSWASAWSEVKKVYPDATCRTIPQIMDGFGNTRPWHDDGKSGWVETCVTINEKSLSETLAIMDLRNLPISADKITSVDANKSAKRCLVKNLAMHGLGLYIYEGEELPEETTKALDLQSEIMALVQKKCAMGDTAKAKVGEYCKAAEIDDNPHLTDEEVTGNPKNIDSVEILEKLKRQLLAIRK